jgi:hypothetical protein
MIQKINKLLNKFICTILLVGFIYGTASAENDWYISLYGGQAVTDDTHLIGILTLDTRWADTRMIAFALGRKMGLYYDRIQLATEGQIVKYWGYQDHEEFNLAFIVRWLPFPWDNHIDTSFAAGTGLSYATEDPELEIDEMGETSKVLLYLLLELEIAVPETERLSVFTRIHHRSAVFGLINDLKGGSNVVTGGLRFSF